MSRFALLPLLPILAATVLAESPPAPGVRNEILGVTTTPAEVAGVKGLRVIGLSEDKPGASAGLSVGDVIVGHATIDIARIDLEEFRPADPDSFAQFPPPVGHMNNEQRLLVYRPSLRRTGILTVRFGGPRAAWPRGSLGIVAVERPGPPIRLRSRTIETAPDVVVRRVHPYSLASRLGIREGDVIAAGLLSRRTVEQSTHYRIGSLKLMKEFLALAADVRPDDKVRLSIMRPVPEGQPASSGDLSFEFEAAELQ